MTNPNPLLVVSQLPFGATPFNKIQKSHFKPAFEAAIQYAKDTFAEIAKDTTAATFENTILRLETAPERVSHVSSIFFNLVGTNSDDEMQALHKEIAPILADFSNDLLLNEQIFHRVKAVWDSRKTLDLKKEELRLTEKTYKDFVRNGALLSPGDKEKLRSIDQKLSGLFPVFSENILKATNDYLLVIDQKEDLEGLTEQVIASYAEAAKEHGHEGKWAVTLHAPSYIPFMTYSPRRSLREKLWRAYNSRAYQENQAVILEIAKLRFKRAQLLGYKTHAEFVLEERMAKTPQTVHGFLNRLTEKVLPAARRDLGDVQKLKKEISGDDSVQPWDYSYWAEKLKHRTHDFNEEELRPYFQLEKVIQGVFAHAGKLYGLVFEPIDNIPVYDPEVKVYEVKEKATGRHIGLFYADFFPRKSKRGGAWMTTFRDQGFHQWSQNAEGAVERPHAAIVCNFTKPTTDTPSLLTLNEVKTLFHEFGHSLHGLLSECKYTSLAGTNVLWDFVELPSQIMENWVSETEGLRLFAVHYKTGEPIPENLIQKIIKTSQFQAGYFALRQLTFATVDLAWHDCDPTEIQDAIAYEQKVLSKLQLLPVVEQTAVSTAFSHIFSGGYSAGYYSYKWAEALDADAFELFKEKGIFNPAVAKSFRDNILSRGGSDDPMTLYKNFRGREPDPDALLRRDGLI